MYYYLSDLIKKKVKYIANILTDRPKDLNVSELYNVISGVEDIVPDVPTLIIGWDKTKGIYPAASIIEWEVDKNTFWTYGKFEKREKFEENIERFNTLAIKKLNERVSYVFYDVFLGGDTKFKSFLESLQSDTKKVAYVSNDMLYLFYDSSLKVIGISLRDCDYIDENYKKQIFSVIYKGENIRLLKKNEDVSKNIRYKIKDREYLIPYIFS